MLSPEAVQVWPNSTWPTSIETFGVLLTSSVSRAAPEEKCRSPFGAVAQELRMRHVHAQAFGGADRGERRLDIAGNAEIAAMDVQRMGDAELLHGAGERLDDLPRRHVVVDVLLVEIELALVELEGADAARD